MGIAKYYKYFTSALVLTISVAILTGCGGDLGKRFSRQPVTEGAFGKVEEDTLSTLLNRYVTQNNLVRYAAWKASPEDIASLKTVASAIGRADLQSMDSNQKKSFLINAYNTLTIDLVLSKYAESLGGVGSPYPGQRSIRNIGNLDAAVWDNFKWTVSGQQMSLNDIENKVLRPLGDSRIHFGINCASMGCPPILNRAFTASDLDQTLEKLASEFVNNGKSTQFDIANSTIRTSEILNWFAQDFVSHFGSVKQFIARYVTVIPADQISQMRVRFNRYDWLLNESVEP
ncbi:MAG: DUF547 domain-containing protein [Bdellovibrionales bacterium]